LNSTIPVRYLNYWKSQRVSILPLHVWLSGYKEQEHQVIS